MQIPKGAGKRLTVSKEIIQFGGLNKTNDYTDGELEGCDRVTHRELPFLETDGGYAMWDMASVAGAFSYRGHQYVVYQSGEVTVDSVFVKIYDQDGSKIESIFYGPKEQIGEPIIFSVIGEWLFYNDRYALNLETMQLKGMECTYQKVVTTESANPQPDDLSTLYISLNGKHHYMSTMLYDVGLSMILENEKNTIYESQTSSSTYDYYDRTVDFEKYFTIGQTVTLFSDVLPEQTRVIRELGRGKITFTEDIEINEGVKWEEGSTFPALSEALRVKIGRMIIVGSRKPFSVYLTRNNRLWGVSDEENTIYASALGNFFTMDQYENLSTDAYTVAVTSDGPFTGGCALSDGVIFFKRDRIYKIVGEYPEEYTLYEHVCSGVRPGAAGSVVVIEDVVYYLGDDGIYVYTGGEKTVLISKNLGNFADELKKGNHFVAVNVDRTYQLAVTLSDGDTWLYIYSLDHGIWTRRKLPAPALLANRHGDEVDLYLDATELVGENISRVLTISRPRVPANSPSWFAEFKPFRGGVQGKKRPSRLLLRMAIECGKWARVLLQLDVGRWKEVALINEPRDPEEEYQSGNDWPWLEGKERVIQIRIPPGRCDVYRLRVEGEGEARIISLTRETVIGGVR